MEYTRTTIYSLTLPLRSQAILTYNLEYLDPCYGLQTLTWAVSTNDEALPEIVLNHENSVPYGQPIYFGVDILNDLNDSYDNQTLAFSGGAPGCIAGNSFYSTDTYYQFTPCSRQKLL